MLKTSKLFVLNRSFYLNKVLEQTLLGVDPAQKIGGTILRIEKSACTGSVFSEVNTFLSFVTNRTTPPTPTPPVQQ